MQNHKQLIMKSEMFLRNYGPFVHEQGMWWNLNIFGKSDFYIFLVRVDYWYLRKTLFLNFRDFQESPNPPQNTDSHPCIRLDPYWSPIGAQ